METDRRLRLWRLVVEESRDDPVSISHLCTVAVATVEIDGAAITVSVDAGSETLHASNAVAADLAELSLTLGEGPSVEAGAGGPALVADLTGPDSRRRWPVFAPAAVSAGARAVFALPLRVGGIRLGVFTLHRGAPGGLGREALSDALVLADTACGLLLDAGGQTHGGGKHGGNGRALAEVGLQHPEVHQATGMIIVQLGVTAAVALVRLRAYAYAHERHLHDVARDVVARRLRFRPDGMR